jgi:hypothetical protein
VKEAKSKLENTDKPDKMTEPDRLKKAERSPRLPKTPKAEKRDKGGASIGGAGSAPAIGADKKEPHPAPDIQEQPPQPREAPRPNGQDRIAYLMLSELRPFKNHPFGIREDTEMKALVESVRDKGVNQPALVRPLSGGGYEIIAGHRRQKASELAGYFEMPCIRNYLKITSTNYLLCATIHSSNEMRVKHNGGTHKISFAIP